MKTTANDRHEVSVTPSRARNRQTSQTHWMQILIYPLRSEDPLVRLYTLSGMVMIAAGLVPPHGAGWGALGCALVTVCYLWDQQSAV